MLFPNKYYHIIVTQNLTILISLTPILLKKNKNNKNNNKDDIK